MPLLKFSVEFQVENNNNNHHHRVGYPFQSWSNFFRRITTDNTMSGRKFSQEQTRPESSSHLALPDLKTVRWLQDQETLMKLYQSTARRYVNLKGMFLVGWYLLVIEVVAVWWWTLLHNIALPQVVIILVGHMDSGTVYVLETVYRKTDWWRDAAGVRFMWFKESVVFFLDRNLTTADKYFGLLQDQIFALIAFLTKPVRLIGDVISNFAAQPGEGAYPKIKNGSLRRNSEGYEAEDNEDFVDEDYLSDASLDSRRLMKEDSRGQLYTRLHTTATAEGKFREAMYVRVRNELSIMRKNSIRFSTGIVNCVRQMVELPTRQSGRSLQELLLSIAKKLRILDLIQTLQENMSGQPYLARPLILVRVLSEAWLAFLLRLVRVKKNRRTRSMRSESLRRRALNPSGMSSLHQLSPAALQQSSEPAPSLRLPVSATLQERVQKLEEEDLEGFPSKDSALGSEDYHSEAATLSDHASPRVEEGPESGSSDKEKKRKVSFSDVTGEQLAQLRAGAPEVRHRGESPSSLCAGSLRDMNGSSGIPRSSLSSGRQSPLQEAPWNSSLSSEEGNQDPSLRKVRSPQQKHVMIKSN
ncbi:uncharacterized protein LOC135211860 isoform X2 [Macrobrachium nipponense]|uniref:uncharacterized protein LOC135211860 isoform X2 n=1 Tax=Macrobrachium nipponense TaxID=159736 RepID=UPI0030C7F828